jgi:hypothetical protein
MAELVDLDQLHLVSTNWPLIEDKSRKPTSNGASSNVQVRRPVAMPARRRRRRRQ